MKQHFKNAMAAAKFLEADPRVDRVIFPGVCDITVTSYRIVCCVIFDMEVIAQIIHLNINPIDFFFYDVIFNKNNLPFEE